MKFEHCRACRDEVVRWAFVVNICQAIFKGTLGVLSGSVALVADALHSSADVVASGVTMVSLKISSRPPDDKHPYGYGNIQYISSSIVGLILIIGALYLIFESVMKIYAGNSTPPHLVALIGALFSAIANELMYRYQSCVGKENNSPAIIANAWDNRSDAISSLAVLAGIALAVISYPIMDSIAAIAVGVLVIRIGVELNIEAIDGLMDGSIEMDTLKQIYKIVMSIVAIEGLSYLRGRRIGESLFIEVDIQIDCDLKVHEGDAIAQQVKDKIFAAIEHVGEVMVSMTPVKVEGKKRRDRLQVPDDFDGLNLA